MTDIVVTNVAKKTRSREEKAVMAVYAFITARIVADPLLSPFFTTTVIRFFELFCLGGMVWFAFRVFMLGSAPKYKGFKFALILIFAFSSLFVVLRGNYSGNLQTMFLAKVYHNGIPAYVLPFIILALPNRKYILSILEVLFWSALFVIPVWFINSLNLVQDLYHAEAVGAYLPVFCAFLILFRNKQPVTHTFISLGLYLIYLFLMILNARRNMIVSLSLFFAIAIIMGDATRLKNSARARLALMAVTAIIIFLFVLNWESLSHSVFDRLLYRGFEDTRSQVEMYFILDMLDSPITDWLFGRGMDGTYFQMHQSETTMEVSFDRNVIETGYLNLLLKGGLLHIASLLAILFTALFKALSTKKNLIRGMGMFLIVYLLDLYMTDHLCYFAVKPVVFWLIISIVFQYDKVGKKKNENRPHLSI